MLAFEPLGDEMLVNDAITRAQLTVPRAPAVAVADTGNTIVTFSGRGPQDDLGVFAKIYGADGNALRPDFRVNSTVNEEQKAPVVAVDQHGNFVVAWQGRGVGDQLGVFLQRYDSAGTPIGGEQLVNSTTGGLQAQPAIAMAADGRFVVVWTGPGSGDFDGIFAQRFDAQGNALGGEFRVNTHTADQQAEPAAAMRDDGSFVVVWSSRHQDGSDWGVYAQAFDAQGARRGGELTINMRSSNSQQSPAVAIDPDGKFTVAWSSLGQDGDSWGIYARRFDSAGNPLSGEILVPTFTAGHQIAPAVAAMPRGGFTVTWTSGWPDGGGWEVYARAFDSSGNSDGEQVRVNSRMAGFASGHQARSSLAVDGRGQAAVVYSGIGPEDFGGVWLRRASGGDACPFDAVALASWKTEQTDGSATGQGRVEFADCLATLREGDSFVVELRTSFVVPQSPDTLSFTFDSLAFDHTDKSFINDAFEAALVDENGNSYVDTYLPNRDAFFNITEGPDMDMPELPPALGDQTQLTLGELGRVVTVDISDLVPGEIATFVLRLVNNDRDIGTSVQIVGYDVPAFGSVPMDMTMQGGNAGVVSTAGPTGSFGSLHTVSSSGTTFGSSTQVGTNSSIVTTSSLATTGGPNAAAPSPSAGTSSTSSTPLAADLNRDGIVDLADLSLIVGRFGAVGASLAEDLNGDGRVGVGDVVALHSQLGATWSPTSATPGAQQNDSGDTLLGDDGTVTFTTSDDFLAGTLFNVNVTTLPDALRLDDVVRTFPFIWIANSGEGTVSKFDTRTGKEIGRYRTGPNAVASWLSPSRTAVDGDGNAWVANRSHVSGSHQQGSIVKVLHEDFIDRNGNGVLDTSQDLNGDGRISGSEVMAWDANGDGFPDDERIALSINVGRNRAAPYGLRSGASVPRATAVDVNDNIWVGLYSFGQYEVYDGQTGEFLAVVATDGAPYGAVIDADGQLWSANRGSYLDHIDTNTRTYAGHSPNHGGDNYGITVGPDGVVWTVTYSGARLIRFDPNAAVGSQITTYSAPGIGAFRGVGVDTSRNVWVAANSPNRMVKFTFADDGVTLLSTQSVAVGNTPSAAVVDSEGFVWTTTYGSGDNRAWKIDPLTVTVVPGWPIATGLEPYNYSDMTGLGRISANRTGTWTELIDAGREGAVWAGLEGVFEAPSGSSVAFRIRTADERSLLPSHAWQIVQPGDFFANAQGRYLEIETKLQSSSAEIHPSVSEIAVTAIQTPQVEVVAPPPGSVLPTGRIVLAGTAIASQPIIGQASLPNAVALVTINGEPVEALDGSGNFFTGIDLLPGVNRFEVEAVDVYGQSTVTHFELTGTQSTPGKYDFRQFADITGSFTGVYARTSFDHSSKLLYTDLATRNDGTFESDVPLLVGVKNISDPTVLVADADGVTPDGIPFFDYSTLVPEGTLDVDESTGPLTISFFNPLRNNFTYELVFYGKLNTPPLITTVPNLEAIIGKPYTYDVDATDLDRDTLMYSLVTAPQNMDIDGTTGIITWTPVAAEQGNHPVVVRVEDGRGGVAEQTYQLNTIVAPPNRPPIITSVPVTVARVGEQGDPVDQVIDLRTWTHIQYEDNSQPDANWVIESNGTVVRQTVNADPSIFLADFDLVNDSIEGTWRTTDGDDDYMGFVFGYQDTGHFYLFDWKQGNQSHRGFAERGMNVKVVSADTPLVGNDLWPHTGNGERVKSLFHNTIPWNQNTEYRFKLEFQPGHFTITVSQGGTVLETISLSDDTYQTGKFGFYNYSQGSVYYAGFTRKALVEQTYLYDVQAIDPDQDTLTYSLVDDADFDIPAGMTVNPATGVIRWGPTPDQAGQNYPVKVQVADGRGGVATQALTICVLASEETHEVVEDIDLQVRDVDQSGLSFDPQLLAVSGPMQATIHNAGADDVTEPFEVTFFEDLNGNSTYDPATDRVLGQTQVRTSILAGNSIPVTAMLAGQVQFTDNRIWVYVDSGIVIEETDEANNVAVEICMFTATPGQFNPQIEWKKEQFTVRPDSNQVMMTPAVIDLNGDRIPDIVFSTFSGSSHASNGLLRAISGADGTDLWTVTDSRYEVAAQAGLAVGDIDGDNFPEIIAMHETDTLIAFEHDGTAKSNWQRSAIWGGINWGSAAIANMDQTGLPEIIVGATVLNADGTVRWRGDQQNPTIPAGQLGRGDNGVGPLSAVADLDLDGSPEIVAGKTAYRANGAAYWNSDLPSDGFPAIGNFDTDPYPEVVVVSRGNVYLLEHDGTRIWGPKAVPGGGNGGAPTIADVDGDGQPEIGVAGATRYVVFETDGSVRWSKVTQDGSSNVTGSSVFDFEGDGNAEIVYGDELFLRIYRGTDGEPLFEMRKGSGTTYEMPLIADVDADGNAEIVAVANDYAFARCVGIPATTACVSRGVAVIGDATDSWVATRQIWNQHSYHVSNVNDDGTIPDVEQYSWQTHNTYRLNALPDPDQSRIAPDLIASFARSTVSDANQVLTARIGNGGSAFVLAGVNVSFYDGDPTAGGRLLGTVQTATRLNPGTFEDVSLSVPAGSVNDLWIVADDDGTGRSRVGECDETNNRFHPGIQTATPNAIPQFASTPAKTALEGRTYRYDVDATDADAGDVVTYSLRYGPAGMAVAADTGIVTWTPGSSDAGKQNIQIIADDGHGGRAIQIFDIDVAEALNTLPQITGDPVATANHGNLYSHNVLATDPDGDALTYSLLTAPVGMTIHPHQGWIRWTPTIDQIGQHEVLLRVQDSTGAGAVQGFQVDVRAANEPPALTSTPPRTATAGQPYEYRVAAQDANGDAIIFRLDSLMPSGMQFDAALGIVRWTPATNQIGSHPVTITALDGRGGVTSQSYQLEVVATSANVAPVINTLPRTTVRVGHGYAYMAEATDANGDPLTYSLEVAPQGMTLGRDSEGNPTSIPGLIYWEPSPDQLGNHTVRLAVTDPRGGRAQQEFTIAVLSQSTNGEPTIVSAPRTLSTVVGRAFQYDLAARDPDNDPLTWRLVAGPVGMSLDAMHGTLRWSPDGDQLGTHTVTVEVSDPFGASHRQTMSLTVSCENLPPAITSRPSTQATVDVPYLYAVRATDPERDPLMYFLDAASVARGMTIDAERGIVRWTPAAAQAGSHEVTVRVEDGAGGVATQRFSILVSTDRPNAAPVITSRAPTVATAESPYLYQVISTDADGDSIRYSLGTTLPGLSIDDVSGQILWTPTADQVRTDPYEITAIASDGRARAYQTFSVFVRANVAPEIHSTPKDRISAGATYRYSVIATDANQDPLTYALVAGPEGMTIDRHGRIIWMPTTDDIRPEPYPVAIRVSDPRGAVAPQAWAILVTPDDVAPKVSIQVIVGVRVYTDNATVDYLNEVTFQVVATDDVGVTNLSLTVDREPLGLDANGRARKVMDRLGIVSAVSSATDAAGNTGQATTTVNVVDPATSGNNVPVIGDPSLPPHPGTIDPNDRGTPTVQLTRFVNLDGSLIEAFTDTDNQAPVTTLTKIYGTVDDPEDRLWYYDVYYARADQVDLQGFDFTDPDYRRLARGTSEVIDGELATFDPTMLSRDPYAIVVVGYDYNGQGYVHWAVANVEGNLVLGNFRLEFTDLSVPLVGIPITINRVYDTTQASTEGDFGYGWSLGLQDAQILETVPAGSQLIPDKTKVYLTNPNGQRVGFTYHEEYAGGAAFLIGCSFGCLYTPSFKPDPGVYDTLTIDETQVGRGGILAAFGEGINPDVYTLTTKDGVKYRYHQTRGLELITDRNGNTVTFTDAGIVHSSGDQIEFVRDNRGRIKQIIDPAGNPLVYRYNQFGDLVSVTDALLQMSAYEYEDQPAHYLFRVVDPAGRTGLRTNYDSNGRLERQVDIDGRSLSFTYDPEGLVQETTDGLGNTHTIIFDPQGNATTYLDPLGNTISRDFDSRNNLIASIDALGNRTDFTYDDTGNRLSVTLPHASDANPAEFTTKYNYDSAGRLTSAIGPSGGGMTLRYDARGQLLERRDTSGQLITFSTYDQHGRETAAGSPFAEVRYEYDAAGRILRSTDSEGGVFDATYDESARLTRLTTPQGLSYSVEYDANGRRTKESFSNGHSIQSTYGPADEWMGYTDSRIGSVERLTTNSGQFAGWSVNGQEQIGLEFDALGRTTKEKHAAGEVRSYEYDEAGRIVTVRDSTGGETLREYDAAGRLTSETNGLGDVTTFSYSPNGDIESINDARGHKWTFTRTNATATSVDPLGNATTTLYTPEGLVAGTILADGTSTRTTYLIASPMADGNEFPLTRIDEGGRERTYNYDESGNLVEATDLARHAYTYTTGVNAASVSTPMGAVTTTSYDSIGRVSAITTSDGQTVRFGYVDANGGGTQPSTLTRPSGVVISSTYDQLDRITAQTSSTGANYAFSYDAGGAIKTASVSGRVTQYENDSAGRLSAVVYPDGSKVRYERNVAGYITAIKAMAATSGTEKVTRYEYDAVGNTTKVTDVSGGVTSLEYDAANRLISRTLPNGISTVYEYDNVGRLLRMDHFGVDQISDLDRTYSRGPSGEPAQIVYGDGSKVQYRFDAGFRIAQEKYLDNNGTTVKSLFYEYDSDGNRVAVVEDGVRSAYSYHNGGQLEQVTTNGGVRTYAHDVDGRLVQVGSNGDATTYGFDEFDNLVAADSPDHSVTYQYDALGNLISKTVGARSVKVLTAPAGSEGADRPYLLTGDVDAAYTFLGDIPLARVTPDGVIYYLTDEMGSVVALADEAGRIVARFDYDAFGNIRREERLSATLSDDFGGDFRFHAGWRDSHTGLYQFGIRHYEASVGLFLSRDPAVGDVFEPETFAAYNFARSNPLLYRDPTGSIAILGYVLNLARVLAVSTAVDYVGGVVTTKLLIPGLRLIFPDFSGSVLDKLFKQLEGVGDNTDLFGDLMEEALCSAFGYLGAKRILWLNVAVNQKGKPVNDGNKCGQSAVGSHHARPDFLLSYAKPTGLGKLGPGTLPKSFIIGDFTLSLAAKVLKYSDPKKLQFKAMARHARNYQYAPVSVIFAFHANPIDEAKVSALFGLYLVKVFIFDFV